MRRNGYSSTQLLLSACRPRLHDSAPSGTNQVQPELVTRSATESSIMLSTDFCVCVDMVRYTVERRVLLYESCEMWLRYKMLEKNRHKFPENTIPSIRNMYNPIHKVSSTWSLLDKKSATKSRVPTEITRQCVRSHTRQITKMPCTRDRHLKIVHLHLTHK